MTQICISSASQALQILLQPQSRVKETVKSTTKSRTCLRIYLQETLAVILLNAFSMDSALTIMRFVRQPTLKSEQLAKTKTEILTLEYVRRSNSATKLQKFVKKYLSILIDVT